MLAIRNTGIWDFPTSFLTWLNFKSIISALLELQILVIKGWDRCAAPVLDLQNKNLIDLSNPPI
jgi:hypothetical protein